MLSPCCRLACNTAFSHYVDYEEFVVFATHVRTRRHLRELMVELSAMTEAEKERRRRAMVAVRPLFDYNAAASPNALEATFAELASRAQMLKEYRPHFAHDEHARPFACRISPLFC